MQPLGLPPSAVAVEDADLFSDFFSGNYDDLFAGDDSPSLHHQNQPPPTGDEAASDDTFIAANFPPVEVEALDWPSSSFVDPFGVNAPCPVAGPLQTKLAATTPHGGPKRVSPTSVLETTSPLSVTSTTTGDLPWPAPPVKKRSRGKQRRRWAFPVLRVLQQQPPPKRRVFIAVGAAAGEGRSCWHCGAEETPQWRAGPDGPKTLCNACGVRFKSGRLVPEYRPANSPTFSSELHSNSHRKILEMRRRKQWEGFAGTDAGSNGLGAGQTGAAPPTKKTRKKRRKKKIGLGIL